MRTPPSPGFPKSFSLGGSFLKAGSSGAEATLTNDDLLLERQAPGAGVGMDPVWSKRSQTWLRVPPSRVVRIWGTLLSPAVPQAPGSEACVAAGPAKARCAVTHFLICSRVCQFC